MARRPSITATSIRFPGLQDTRSAADVEDELPSSGRIDDKGCANVRSRGRFRFTLVQSLHSGARVCEREGILAKRANYGFEKRQREIRKQKRKEEKAARKREEADTSDQPGEEALDGTPPGSSSPDRD